MKRRSAVSVICLIMAAVFMMSFAACGAREELADLTDEGFDGKSIALTKGTSFENALKEDERFRDVTYVRASNTSDSLGLIFRGKADYFVTDRVNAEMICSKYRNVRILDEAVTHEYFGFAVQKESLLREQFNGILSELRSDGTLDAMKSKWMGSGRSEKIVPVQELSEVRGKIKVAVNSLYEPMCYRDEDGNITGFDIDLLFAICDRLGYRVEFVEEDLDMLVPLVSIGKANVALSGLSITDERLELVDFTDSYFDSGAVLIARDDRAGSNIITALKNGFYDTFIEEERASMLADGLLTTLKILIAAFVIGNTLGFLVFLWVYGGNRTVTKIVDTLTMILVHTPTSTALLIMFYLVFGRSSASSALIASVALGFMFGNCCCDDWRTSAKEFSKTELEAAYSMGYTRYQALFKLILPRIAGSYLSLQRIEVIILCRDTSLVGMISATDISMVFDAIREETMEPFVPVIFTAITYIVLAFIAGKLVSCIGIGLDYKKRTPEQIDSQILKGSDRA